MNVLVVSLPGLRLHHLGCYGNEWTATPALDRLASQGVVFDRHYADNPGAPPVRPALADHGVVCAFLADIPASIGADDSPWDEACRRTLEGAEGMPGDSPWCLWVEWPSLAPPWGLPDEVLSAYFDDDEESGPWAGTACGPIGADDDEYVRLHQTYAAVVTHVDGALEEFLNGLQGLPAFAHTLLILTSDRGLALGEHGVVGEYRPWLHDEMVHLPLLMRLPGAAEAGRRVPALTQPVDLTATVLDALGIPATETAGQSLLPLARGQQPSARQFACTSLRLGEALEWSLRTRDWAYLLPVQVPPGDPPRPPQLYAKPKDAWEVNDVRHHHVELAEHLEEQLRGHMERVARGGAHEHREVGG